MGESAAVVARVNSVMKHYASEIGKDLGSAVVVGIGAAYADSKGHLDYSVGSMSVPVDLASGLLLMGLAKKLPKMYEMPIWAMNAGSDLFTIGVFRKAGHFFGAKSGASASGDFGAGFGGKDPLLAAADAL